LAAFGIVFFQSVPAHNHVLAKALEIQGNQGQSNITK
jgi:hypothetical protein